MYLDTTEFNMRVFSLYGDGVNNNLDLALIVYIAYPN